MMPKPALNEQSPQAQTFNWKRNWWVVLLLALASYHCAQSIFYDNVSYIDLLAYENGAGEMPFQGRVSMMPILRLAHGNALMRRLGDDLAYKEGNPVPVLLEPFSPEKVASFAVGVVCIFWMVWLTSRFGWRRFQDQAQALWWLPPALFLAVLYVSYAARADTNLWYPYDLPHAALFTAALLALLSESWVPLTLTFVIDCTTRETAVYLLPCILAVGYSRGKLRSYTALAGGLFTFWLAVYLLIAHTFRANPTDVGLHYHQDFRALREPKHLPQLASVVGYLWLPILVWRRLLRRSEQALLLGALAGIAVSAVFGIWYETRVWSEWNAIAACFAAVILLRYLANRQPA